MLAFLPQNLLCTKQYLHWPPGVYTLHHSNYMSNDGSTATRLLDKQLSMSRLAENGLQLECVAPQVCSHLKDYVTTAVVFNIFPFCFEPNLFLWKTLRKFQRTYFEKSCDHDRDIVCQILLKFDQKRVTDLQNSLSFSSKASQTQKQIALKSVTHFLPNSPTPHLATIPCCIQFRPFLRHSNSRRSFSSNYTAN